MKILSADEIRNWDQYTIEQQRILSIDLMERAAAKCVDWLIEQYPDAPHFSVFCGKGNNGGDGLAIARMLLQKNYTVSVYILEFGHKGTADFQTNLARLHLLPGNDIHFIQSQEHFHPFPADDMIIDALFGSGLNRELEGVTADLVAHINASGKNIISLDIPSGLFTDRSSKNLIAVQAAHTLSFQCYKPAFLFAENQETIGQLHILDIGLDPRYYGRIETDFELTDEIMIRAIHRPRKPFSHKGHFGHALLLAGSEGKMGAAVLTTRGCLRSGAGLVTCQIPASGILVLQSAAPEAMVTPDIHHSFLTKAADLSKYDAIGIGPGIGTQAETILLLESVLNNTHTSLVIDADALNCMAAEKRLLEAIPHGSILTPHPKEFERLFGETINDYERTQLAIRKSAEHNCVIVLKGHHTCICSAGGKTYFNSTGNAGMASAGSGDVLTGILTGLLAQGYSSIESAILGVYLHGVAGDLAAKEKSMEAMIAGDIIDKLGAAFKFFDL